MEAATSSFRRVRSIIISTNIVPEQAISAKRREEKILIMYCSLSHESEKGEFFASVFFSDTPYPEYRYAMC